MHCAAEHDGLGQAECRHGHHEGEGGAEGDAFLKEHHGDRDDGGAAPIHGHAEHGCDRHGEDAGRFH